MVESIGLKGCLVSYGLLVVVLFISHRERLKLEKDIVVSFVRMSVQLFVAGFVLIYLFRLDNLLVNVAVFVVMVGFATDISLSRAKLKGKGIWFYVFLSILLSAGVVLLFVFFGVIRMPYLHARYFIPLAGMIIGNSMNSTAIGAERFFSKLEDNKDAVFDLLGIGATMDEALAFIGREALRAAILPSLTSASGMGIVFLPGMMTGQILSGVNPQEAVFYQIMIVVSISTVVCLSNYLMIRTISKRINFI
ncbi:ABC transporter permease [Hippea sp. KM1]|uniref:ABC transporter permease n=1 Tax=Hippea sp. KM1 TaxID=944481 RepID=UPI00046C9C71|nr:iron export ABC transporter permease subunit FetB [Hippea sp. KM1]